MRISFNKAPKHGKLSNPLSNKGKTKGIMKQHKELLGKMGVKSPKNPL